MAEIIIAVIGWNILRLSATLDRALFRSTVSGQMGWIGEFSHVPFAKPVSVGLVDKLFQPASNQVKTIEKAFA